MNEKINKNEINEEVVLKPMVKAESLEPGRGLDVGTGFLCVASLNSSGDVITKSVRDSFLQLTPSNKMAMKIMRKGLEKAGINFLEDSDSFYVLGEDSLNQSVERSLTTKRPMSKGVISPVEANALPMFKALLKELLGDPLCVDEQILYSVPASPSDAPFDIVYHENVIEAILNDLGFKGKSINEAHAIVFSELEDDEDSYSGMTLSFGAGMTNVCIANMADVVTTFSVSKGGDYIDLNSAISLGYDPKDSKSSEITPSLITYIKEQGVDIRNPGSERTHIAISSYYKALIKYVVSSIISQINSLDSKPKFLEPIKVVVSGGTSKAIGFLELFSEEFEEQSEKLPFKIKAIVHAEDPLTAVAEGALTALMVDYEDN